MRIRLSELRRIIASEVSRIDEATASRGSAASRKFARIARQWIDEKCEDPGDMQNFIDYASSDVTDLNSFANEFMQTVLETDTDSNSDSPAGWFVDELLERDEDLSEDDARDDVKFAVDELIRSGGDKQLMKYVMRKLKSIAGELNFGDREQNTRVETNPWRNKQLRAQLDQVYIPAVKRHMTKVLRSGMITPKLIKSVLDVMSGGIEGSKPRIYQLHRSLYAAIVGDTMDELHDAVAVVLPDTLKLRIDVAGQEEYYHYLVSDIDAPELHSLYMRLLRKIEQIVRSTPRLRTRFDLM